MENIPVVRAYVALDTQWLVGMGGRTGLRYESVLPWLDRFGQKLGITDVDTAFEALQIMEHAELQVDAERRVEARESGSGHQD